MQEEGRSGRKLHFQTATDIAKNEERKGLRRMHGSL